VDWKRVIVGDAFRLPSKDINVYRDLFLVWPFLLFSVAAITNFLRSGVNHRLGLKFLALAVVCLLLAREKFLLIGGALGFCFFQSQWAFFIKHDIVGLWVGIVTAILLIVFGFALKNYKPKVQYPRGQSIATLLLGLCSFGLTILLIRWIAP
jgi:hypothetical protein